MSWLHCMWGVGASVSPYIMSYALSDGQYWNSGYFIVAIIQIALTAVIFASLPLWKKASREIFKDASGASQARGEALPLKKVFGINGAAACFLCFFCYCALEQTAMFWASSYMVSHNAFGEEAAAMFASLFFLGITAGRGLNGFLTFRFSDRTLIRAGYCIICVGVALISVPSADALTIAGFVVLGLGCAPVYPGIIHSTPALFGVENSQAMIGVQMAFAYIGGLASPLFGLFADAVTPNILPAYIAFFLVIMIAMHEVMVKRTSVRASG